MIHLRGIKKYRGQKRPITASKMKVKKLLLGPSVTIKQKEIKLGPHRGTTRVHLRGMKKNEVKNEQIPPLK